MDSRGGCATKQRRCSLQPPAYIYETSSTATEGATLAVGKLLPLNYIRGSTAATTLAAVPWQYHVPIGAVALNLA